MNTVTELNKIRVRAKDVESLCPFLGLHVSATCRVHVPCFRSYNWRRLCFCSSYGWNRIKSSTFDKYLGPTQAGNKPRKLLFMNYFGRCQGNITWQFWRQNGCHENVSDFLVRFYFRYLIKFANYRRKIYRRTFKYKRGLYILNIFNVQKVFKDHLQESFTNEFTFTTTSGLLSNG